jgi:hypothetical protein
MDAEEKLKETVKDMGDVTSIYGGFEIRVLKPKSFPWYKAFKQLIDIDQKIWVHERERKICIISEPRVQ